MTWRSVGRADKRAAKAQVRQLAKEAAQAYLTAAVQVAAMKDASGYVPVAARGDVYADDPRVREAAWRAANYPLIGEARAAALPLLHDQARDDPDPLHREFAWAAIQELSGRLP